MDWRDFPLPDGSYSDDCRPFTQQDVCNYLPTFAEATGTRSRTKYVPVPGLVTLAGVGNGPHRGIRDVEGKLFVVSGNTLYQVATDGTATSRGTIPGTRRVSMVHNQIDGGNELIIATGDNSYVWNTVDETLTATGVPLLFVDFLNQLIIGIDVARRFWRWSGLADATSWNSLDNESAESSPDRLVGQIVSQGEVLLFGERTIEVWSNSPSGNLTFQRSTVIEKGCANGNTICRLDNTVYFVGNDSIAYRLQGYTPVPISSKAITDSISDGDPSKLFAFTWEDKGYVVYYLTAQDGNTWGFDVTCQKWHRRESFGLDRWRVNTLCKWNGDWYAGDYSSGKLYRLTWGSVYEGCEIMPRTLRTGVMHNNGNRMFVSALKLLVNTGREPSVGTGGTPPAISGSLPDGFIGDVVSYQLTVTPAYVGQQITVTATGLPTGLSCSTSGLIAGTMTAAGEFTPVYTAADDCGSASASDAVTVGGMTLAGNMPDGAVGDTGTTTYTADHHVGAVTYTLESGTLPPGATLGSDGVAPYDYTTSGSYSFRIKGTDTAGNFAYLDDTVAVSIGEWWLTRTAASAGNDELYIGSNPTAFPTTTTRSPFLEDASYGAVFIANDLALIAYKNTVSTQAERITDFAYGDGVTNTTLVTVPASAWLIRSFGGVSVITTRGSTIYFSTDGWDTYTTCTLPSGANVYDVSRLSNGRWVTAGVGVAPQYFYYSDEEVPTTWTQGVRCDDTGVGSAGKNFITDGNVIVTFCGTSDLRRTEDGAAWGTVTLASHGVNSINNPAVGSNGVFAASMDGGSDTKIKISTDAGLSWIDALVASGYAASATRIEYGEGYWAISCVGGFDPPRVYVSNDDLATFSQATLPFTAGSGDTAIAVFVRRTP